MSAQVFRPTPILTVLMTAAGVLWAGVLLYLLSFQAVPLKTLSAAIFFVVFFAIAGLYYGRTAIFVDAKGFTYRGLTRTLRISYRDIRKVDVLPGPVVVYSIRGPERFVHFTSFFQHHQRLVQLLVERAGLSARG